MILINLLPHRERARRRRRAQFVVWLALSGAFGGVLCGAVYAGYRLQVTAQQDRNHLLRAEIARLDADIQGIAALQAQIASWRAHQAALESLQGNRNLPVHLLDELVTRMPDGLYLTSLKQDGQSVLLTGVAQSQERVSELLRNLATQGHWVSDPRLVEILASTAVEPRGTSKPVSHFSLRAQLARPADRAAATPVTGTTNRTPAPGNG